jgi:hypothetical protein
VVREVVAAGLEDDLAVSWGGLVQGCMRAYGGLVGGHNELPGCGDSTQQAAAVSVWQCSADDDATEAATCTAKS